jgi:hypothetical protein
VGHGSAATACRHFATAPVLLGGRLS